jgi:enoyl-CoA hydratase/carnithine racemase
LFSARKIPATIAHQWGGVHILAPIATFDDAANQMIQAIRNNAPLTLEAAKFAIRSLGATDGDTELEVRRLYMRADQSRDYQEGLSAFAEKRSPSFRGE